MNAYIHIGTMKTGTTSIQEFLSVNQDKLLKQSAYFPVKFFGKNQRSFCFCFYKENRKDAYAKILEERGIKNLIQFKRSLFCMLEQEISKIKFNKFVISAEGFSLDLDYDEIVYMKKYLEKIFDKIKIVCYLREKSAYTQSMYSQSIKGGSSKDIWSYCELFAKDVTIDNLKNYTKVFGKENIIVKIFNKNEFYKGDLLKDFIYNIGLEWDDDFIIPEKENESLDLLGMELLKALNRKDMNSELRPIAEKFFSNNEKEKFLLPIDLYMKMNYSKESNEWVRKEFFPHKERLFPKKDLTNYKENYEIQEMKQEYWDRIAEFIADIVKIKNQVIMNKNNLLEAKEQQISTLTAQNTQLNNTINSIPHRKANLELEALQLDIANKKLNLKKQEKELGIKLSQIEPKITLNLIKPNSATQRIKNQLSYKLGQAMINNSKSLLGYIRMPYVLSYIKETHQREQETYQQSIKQNPNLKLPPLESYADYQEALKIKNHLTYKLGAALIKANNVRGGGQILSFIRFLKEVRRLKREYKGKQC